MYKLLAVYKVLPQRSRFLISSDYFFKNSVTDIERILLKKKLKRQLSNSSLP